MAIPEGVTEVFYGLQMTGDTELMGVTMAWTTGGGVPPLEDCEGHYNRWATAWRPRITGQYQFVLGRFSTGTAGGDFTQEVVPTTALSGTASGIALPNNTSILIAKITAAGGRRNRGRMFVPGVPTGTADQAGVLTPAFRTAWQTTVDDWLEAEETIGWGVGALLHQTGSPGPTTITNLIVRNRVATQRRRLRP